MTAGGAGDVPLTSPPPKSALSIVYVVKKTPDPLTGQAT